MIYEINSFNDSQDVQADADVNRWKEAGAALGCTTCGIQPRGGTRRRSTNRQGRIRALVAKTAANPQGENADCVLDNFRLIFGADKEAREFCNRARRYPAIVDSRGAEIARVSVLARAYLEEAAYRFNEAELAAFVEGYEQTATLNMEEIWALKPALLLELVDRLTDTEPALWPVLVGSLKKVNDTAWKEFFESVSYTHRILTADPAGAYLRMDFESRQQYREAVADLAKCSPLSEREVAEAAIDFCEDAFESSDGSRAAVRRTHIGYYLLDRGRSRLESIIDYRPPLVQRLHRLIRQHPTTFYLAGI